jgi:peptidoglycan/LPS O-acetylase OafA/YrhL
MENIDRVDFANTLRGFAALSVLLIHHYCGVFWGPREGGWKTIGYLINAPSPPKNYVIPIYISWLNIPHFDWGSYGVALFFIISGFVIPFSLKKMSGLGFMVNRFFRIVPTYAAGFSVVLLAIAISTEYFGSQWPFSLKEILIHYVPGIRDIFWSRSIDGVVWTLEIEMKFYLLCALLMVWFRRQSRLVFLLPVLLFAVVVYLNLNMPSWRTNNISTWRLASTGTFVCRYIIFMFIGVMFHYRYQGKIGADRAYLGIGGLFVLFCLIWRLYGANSPPFTMAWSYAFALLTFCLAYSFPRLFKGNPIFNFFADISYPLYVVHAVPGYVALSIMLDQGYNSSVSLLTVTLGSFLLAWLLHLSVERPTQKLGKCLASKMGGGRSPTLKTELAPLPGESV